MRSYTDVEYARSRLLETVVLLDGEPVTVATISGDGSVTFVRLVDSIVGICKLNQLDINPVQLGYVNGKSTAYYVSRAPMRRDWRQGLRVLNTRSILGERREVAPTHLVNTIKGVYPSVKKAFDMLGKGSVKSVAFSRNFAIAQHNSIFFKEKWEVGEMDVKKSYVLHRKMDWVREQLEDELSTA